MSAIPPKVDIVQHGGNVRFVPKADIGNLFDRSDRGNFSNKASSALEGGVAPEPGYGDNETIPEAN